MKLEETINMILDVELPLFRKIEIAYVPKIKKLLSIIAESSPFMLKIQILCIYIMEIRLMKEMSEKVF
jgi:hypothetical protein